jgi:hypothetical protein
MEIDRTNYRDAITKMQTSPGTSYWLKDALNKALNRDCVDACHDAEALAAVLRARCDDLLSTAP